MKPRHSIRLSRILDLLMILNWVVIIVVLLAIIGEVSQ